MAMKRGYWADPPGDRFGEDGVEFTSSEEGLVIAVTDEQAVDSYNATFTCDWLLTPERARALRDWLNEVIQ